MPIEIVYLHHIVGYCLFIRYQEAGILLFYRKIKIVDGNWVVQTPDLATVIKVC